MLLQQKEAEELDLAIMHEVEVDDEKNANKKKEIAQANASDDEELVQMMQNNEDEDYLAGILDDE